MTVQSSSTQSTIALSDLLIATFCILYSLKNWYFGSDILLSPCIMCVHYIRDVQYIGGGISTSGGCHEYIGGGGEDIMMHVGEQVDESLSIYVENPDVLNIPRCTHDIPTYIIISLLRVLRSHRNITNKRAHSDSCMVCGYPV